MEKELKFIPIDYDYFDFEGKNYIKMIGRDGAGRKVCIIDTYAANFYLIIKKGYDANPILKKIHNLEVKKGGRITKILKMEVLEKNFLGKKRNVIRVWITNHKDAQEMVSSMGNLEEVEFRREWDIGLITKYIKEKKVNPLQWYSIKGNDSDSMIYPLGLDKLDISYCVVAKEIIKADTNNIFVPKILAYDIETNGREIGKDEIIMISIFGDGIKKVVTWKNVSDVEDYVEIVKSEEEMILRFCEIVRDEDADILCGYFSDGFDLPYLKARADYYNIILDLGINGKSPVFAKGRVPSGKISGLVHFDLYRFVESVFSQYLQSETLSLNEVAGELVGNKKEDFDFGKLGSMTKKDWYTFFSYNLQDSKITYQLAQKLWPDVIEFCKIIKEPVFNITRAKMATHVENHILHNLDRFNEVAERRPGYNEINLRKMSGKFEGANVFEPTPGFYKDLVMFDFTSMHASLIVTFNISGQSLKVLNNGDYYVAPEFKLDGKKTQVYFDKKPGFFSILLSEVVEMRKKFKKEYKKSLESNTSDFDIAVKKASSNAYKLLANATFGYQGFYGARYYSREAAAATLSFVRKFNKDTMKKIEDEGYRVIYGDSVDGKTKIFIKIQGTISEVRIETLFKKSNKRTSSGKEYNFLDDIEVLTLDKNGKSVFNPISYIMRHKCKKKMFRVHFNDKWSIEVSEDHSLMGYPSHSFNKFRDNKRAILNNIIEVSPEEIDKEVNSIVSLKKIPYKTKCSSNYSKEIYEFIGFFLAHQNLDTDKIIKLGGSLGYTKNFQVSQDSDNKILINGLKLTKTILDWLFEENEEKITSFFIGLFSIKKNINIEDNKVIISCEYIYEDIDKIRKLLYRIGISHAIVIGKKKNFINIIIEDKDDFFNKIGLLSDRRIRNANNDVPKKSSTGVPDLEFSLQKIKSIEEIEMPEYIYDIEVEGSHRFFANYVLVHNTDSISFLRNAKTKEEILDLLHKINEELPGIMELDLEDFYSRGIFVAKRGKSIGAKKKYALLSENGKIKIRGFETVRRDWCKLSRNLQDKVLRSILNNGDESAALELVKGIVKKLRSRDVELEDLTIQTKIKKPLEEYLSNGPHIAAAKKMIEAGDNVSVGTFVEYFIGEGSGKLVRDKVFLKGERVKYDIEYYLRKQILPAVEGIFSVFDVDINAIIDGERQKKLF